MYLYSSIRAKKETELEFNYKTKEKRKRILNGIGD